MIVAMRPLPEEVRLGLLSPREREVLALALSGMSMKEIAYHLAIGLKTAHTHKLTAYRKLGCRSTIEMVKFAIRVGLIKAD